MDEIGEFDRVLDEEHRHIVADDVPVTFLGVEFDRKSSNIARQIR